MTMVACAMIERLIIRDSCVGDLGTLSNMRPSEAIHRDRIADADGVHLRYLVAEQDQSPVGFGLLVFDPPKGWPATDLSPKMIDLWVKPELRSCGIGSALVHYMECATSEMGIKRVICKRRSRRKQACLLPVPSSRVQPPAK